MNSSTRFGIVAGAFLTLAAASQALGDLPTGYPCMACVPWSTQNCEIPTEDNQAACEEQCNPNMSPGLTLCWDDEPGTVMWYCGDYPMYIIDCWL